MAKLKAFWRWLLFGSDELILPKSWLANKARLGNYIGYTRRQLQQGSVTKDTAWFRRAAFWEAQAAQQQARRSKVISGRFQ